MTRTILTAALLVSASLFTGTDGRDDPVENVAVPQLRVSPACQQAINTRLGPR